MILPRSDVALSGVASAAVPRALPLLRHGALPQWAVDTGWRPLQPFWLKRRLLRSGSTVSKATRAGGSEMATGHHRR